MLKFFKKDKRRRNLEARKHNSVSGQADGGHLENVNFKNEDLTNVVIGLEGEEKYMGGSEVLQLQQGPALMSLKPEETGCLSASIVSDSGSNTGGYGVLQLKEVPTLTSLEASKNFTNDGGESESSKLKDEGVSNMSGYEVLQLQEVPAMTCSKNLDVEERSVESWEDWDDDPDETVAESNSNLDLAENKMKVREYFQRYAYKNKNKNKILREEESTEVDDDGELLVSEIDGRVKSTKISFDRKWVVTHPRFIAKRNWLRTDYRKRQAMENSLDPYRHEFGPGYSVWAYFPKQIGTYLNPKMGLFRDDREVIDKELIVGSELKTIKRKLAELIPDVHRGSPFDQIIGTRVYFFQDVIYLILFKDGVFTRYRLMVNKTKFLAPRPGLKSYFSRIAKVRHEHSLDCRMSYCTGCLMACLKKEAGFFSVDVDIDQAMQKMASVFDSKLESIESKIEQKLQGLPSWESVTDQLKHKTAWMDDLTEFSKNCQPFVQKVKDTVSYVTNSLATGASALVTMVIIMVIGVFLLYKGYTVLWDLLVQLSSTLQVKKGFSDVLKEAGNFYKHSIILETGPNVVKAVISTVVMIMLWACGIASWRDGDLKNRAVAWCANYVAVRRASEMMVDDIFEVVKLFGTFLHEQWGIEFLKNWCQQDGSLAVLLKEAHDVIIRMETYNELEFIINNANHYRKLLNDYRIVELALRQAMLNPAYVDKKDHYVMLSTLQRQYEEAGKRLVDADVVFELFQVRNIKKQYSSGNCDIFDLSRRFYALCDKEKNLTYANYATKEVKRKIEMERRELERCLPRPELLDRDPRILVILQEVDAIAASVIPTNTLDYQDWAQLVQYRQEVNLRITEVASGTHEQLQTQYKAAISKIDNILKEFGTRGSKGNGFRVTPTGVLLVGKSRCGKNTILMYLIQALVAKFGTQREKEALVKAYNTVVYNWASEIEFHDGYFGQMITLLDELMQVNESQTEDSVFMEVIRLINTNQADVNMANLGGKSGVPFVSRFILATSNQISVQGVKGIMDKSAFANRFNSFLVAPGVKYSTPASVAVYEVTKNPHDLIPNYIRSHDHKINPYFWQFYKIDLMTGKVAGDTMDFDQFFKLILEIAQKEQESGTAKLNFQQETAKVFCDSDVIFNGNFMEAICQIQEVEVEKNKIDSIFHSDDEGSPPSIASVSTEAGKADLETQNFRRLWQECCIQYSWLATATSEELYTTDAAAPFMDQIVDFCLQFDERVAKIFCDLKGWNYFNWFSHFRQTVTSWVKMGVQRTRDDLILILKSFAYVYDQVTRGARGVEAFVPWPRALHLRMEEIAYYVQEVTEYETCSEGEIFEEDLTWMRRDFRNGGRNILGRLQLYLNNAGPFSIDFHLVERTDYRRVAFDLVLDIVHANSTIDYLSICDEYIWNFVRRFKEPLFLYCKKKMEDKVSRKDMLILSHGYKFEYQRSMVSIPEIVMRETRGVCTFLTKLGDLFWKAYEWLTSLPGVITVCGVIGFAALSSICVSMMSSFGINLVTESKNPAKQGRRKSNRKRKWRRRKMKPKRKKPKKEAGRITQNDLDLVSTLLDKNVYQLYSVVPSNTSSDIIVHGMVVFFAARSAYMPYHSLNSWVEVAEMESPVEGEEIRHFLRNGDTEYAVDFFEDVVDVVTLDMPDSSYEYDVAFLTFAPLTSMRSRMPDRKNIVSKHISASDKNLQNRFNITLVKPASDVRGVSEKSRIVVVANLLAEKMTSTFAYDEYKAPDAIVYSTVTGAGSSGSAIVLTGDTRFPESKMFGIHVARGSDRCYGIPVYRELLEQYLEELETPESITVECGTLPSHLILVRDKEPDGSNIPCNRPMQSNDICKTRIHGKIWPANEKLSQVAPTVEEKLKGIDKWQIATEKYCKKAGPADNRRETFDLEALRKVTNFLYNEMSAQGKTLPQDERVYPTFEEIVLGYSDGSVQGIPIDTSAGWPKNLRSKKKYDIMGDQKPGLDPDERQKFLNTPPMRKLRAEFEECLEMLDRGEMPEVVFSDFPKAEVVPKTKDKIRIVSGSPLLGQMLERHFLMPFIKWLRIFRITNRQAIGINPFSEADVVVKFLEFLERIIAGDHNGWDTDYEKRLWDEAFYMVDRFYGFLDVARTLFYDYLRLSKHITVRYELPDRIFDKVENHYVPTKDIVYDIETDRLLYDGKEIKPRNSGLKTSVFIYQWYGGMPSGAWVTADFNSLGNNIKTMYMACFAVLKERGIEFDESSVHGVMPEMLRCFRTLTFGDDIIAAVSPDLPELNQYTLRDAFAHHGSVFTSADKGEFTKPYCMLEKETSFLCRFFRYEGGRWYMVLDPDSIYSRFNWLSDKKREEEIMLANCLQANIELGGYSSTEYAEHLTKYLRPISDEYGYEPMPFKLARERNLNCQEPY